MPRLQVSHSDIVTSLIHESWMNHCCCEVTCHPKKDNQLCDINPTNIRRRSNWTSYGIYHMLLDVLQLVVSTVYHSSNVTRLWVLSSSRRPLVHQLQHTNSTTVIIPIQTSPLNAIPTGIAPDDYICVWWSISWILFESLRRPSEIACCLGVFFSTWK